MSAYMMVHPGLRPDLGSWDHSTQWRGRGKCTVDDDEGEEVHGGCWDALTMWWNSAVSLGPSWAGEGVWWESKSGTQTLVPGTKTYVSNVSHDRPASPSGKHPGHLLWQPHLHICPENTSLCHCNVCLVRIFLFRIWRCQHLEWGHLPKAAHGNYYLLATWGRLWWPRSPTAPMCFGIKMICALHNQPHSLSALITFSNGMN